MKITFSNLGAIKKTTLDLRPLTVIIGPNNSNKTYIAYSIYGLWQRLIKDFGSNIPKLKFKKEDKQSYSLKINDEFYELFIKDCNEIALFFKLEMANYFQDFSNKLFTSTNIELEISREEITEGLVELNNIEPFEIRANEILKISFQNETLSFKFEKKLPEIEKEFSRMADEDFLHQLLSYYLKYGLFFNPFLLPVERNAFIITYKILENRRYKLLKQARRNLFSHTHDINIDRHQLELFKEQGDYSYPQPIEDFLDFLTEVEFKSKVKDVSNLPTDFAKLADKIEKSIQGNNKTNLKPTKTDRREIKINVKKGLDVDLYNASSSIKQLAPLLLYLRYRAQENDLLIIDEPEMNLHPESQAKLLEVLGMLVNAGVNVLLTTHSPYFMSHLNNLIAGDMNDDETREKQAKSLYLGDARAFLKPEDVGAYEMRQNKAGNQTLHALHGDKDYGIRWDTLSDVSADIQQKFFEIYEQKENSSNGEEEK